MRRLAIGLVLAACTDGAVQEPAPDAEDPALPSDVDDAPQPSADPEPPEPEPEPIPEPEPPVEVSRVRFVALGDAGEGNTAQFEVSRVIEQVCADRGCDFALYLGDNIYSNGVDGVDDDQFRTKFEEPYANLAFPFWVTLGNHDFGEIPLQFWKTDYQVEYTRFSDKWTLPDHFYTFSSEHAQFFSMDTNMIMLGLDWTQDQGGWIDDELSRSSATWKIAFGHHPYISNGEHGNAGNYEGAWFDFTGIVRGDNVRDYFHDHLCGKVDVYFSGHDHSRQWLEPACGMEFVVSGAGAKLDQLPARDGNLTRFEDNSQPGFIWVEIVDRTMNLAFYRQDGSLDYEGSLTK